MSRYRGRGVTRGGDVKIEVIEEGNGLHCHHYFLRYVFETG